MLLEEGNRTAQNRFVEVVTQVSDHAESRVVHQKGSDVIANTLQQGRDDQRERNQVPRIMEIGWDKLLQRKAVMRSRNGKKGNWMIRLTGIQDMVEDGLYQKHAKCFQQSNCRHQNDSTQRLPPMTAHVVKQTQDTLHLGTLPNGLPSIGHSIILPFQRGISRCAVLMR